MSRGKGAGEAGTRAVGAGVEEAEAAGAGEVEGKVNKFLSARVGQSKEKRYPLVSSS